jgi:hypothetical protein
MMTMFESLRHTTSPDLTPVERKELQRLERKQRRRQLELAGTAFVAMALSLLKMEYTRDVEAQKALIDTYSISIGTEHAEALDPMNNDRAVVLIDGYGSFDSRWLATHFGTEVQRELYDGQVWYLSYGNAPLSTPAIADRIIEKAAEEGVDEIVMVGQSAGSIVSTRTIPYIHNESDITVDFSVNISAPYNEESLRMNKRMEMDGAEIAKFFLPGIEYSTYARGALEFFLRADQISDMASFWKTRQDINSYIHDAYTPSTRLLFDQAYVVRTADFPGMYDAINRSLAEEQAFSVYNFTTDGYDAFLDDRQASEAICEAANISDISCNTYEIEGLVHARTDQSIEAVRQTLSSAASSVAEFMTQKDVVTHNDILATEPRPAPIPLANGEVVQ